MVLHTPDAQVRWSHFAANVLTGLEKSCADGILRRTPIGLRQVQRAEWPGKILRTSAQPVLAAQLSADELRDEGFECGLVARRERAE
jgi:hypothetical protein